MIWAPTSQRPFFYSDTILCCMVCAAGCRKQPSTSRAFLPTRDYHSVDNRQIQEVNAALEKMAARYNARYIHLYDAFAGPDNKLKADLSFDGVHINGKGYAIMKTLIQPHLQP